MGQQYEKEALDRSEKRYQELVESARDIFFSLSRQGTIVSLNPAFEWITGWPCSEWLGKHFAGVVHPDDLGLAMELFQRVLGGESPPISTLRIRHKLGEYWVGEFLGFPQVEGGEITGALGIVRDVTELKQAESALLEKTSHIQLLRDVTAAANEASTLEEAMPRALEQICSAIGWPVGHVYLLRGDGTEELVSKAIWNTKDPEQFRTFRQLTETFRFKVGVGLPGRVLASKKPEWITDVTKDPDFVRARLDKEIEVKAGFGVPVIAATEAVAVLEFYSDRVLEPNKPLLEVMVQVGIQLGRLAERERSEKERRLQLDRIQTLHEIGTTITSTLDLRTVLDLLLEKVDQLLPYSASGVRLMNPETGKFEPITTRNMDTIGLEAARAKSGSGLSELVLESRAPVMISDVRMGLNSELAEFFFEQGLVSYLGLPMKAGDQFLGTLSVLTKQKHNFTDDEIAFLTTLANQAAAAIHNSQLYEQIIEKTRSLSALHAVTATASQSLDLDVVLQTVIRQLTNIFHFDVARIYLLNSEREELHLRASFEVQVAWRRPWRVRKVGTGITGMVAQTGKTMVFENIHNDPRYQALSESKYVQKTGFSFTAVFPVKVKEKVVGTVVFINQKPRRLTTEEIQLIESIMNGVGVAIENASLFEKTKTQAVELEKSNRAKEEFLTFISHELKTPLNMVIGYTAMIHDSAFGEITPAQEKALRKVSQNSKELLAMIDSLLNASKAQTETIQIEKQEVNLKHLFDELRSNYDCHIDKDLSLIWDYPSELPTIKTDGEKLRHILQNLINNAIKYTDKGNVTISAQYRPATKGVELRVTDTGIGIAREAADFIFDRFTQMEPARRRAAGGVGLGLYIVKQFTELLGGEIKLESNPGKGSVFTVVIPIEI